jgi:DNA-binding transcriptional LysR family regulator
MDVRGLRQVVAIRQHGSFAKAAEALGLSQPSLSKSIARLEDELKLKIFDRSSQGSVLTPIGELIVERAERVIHETRDLVRDAALLAGGEAGGVRIGCTTSLQNAFLQPLVLRIAREHPKLRIHAELAASERLLPLLDARELDLVFSARPPPEGVASAYFVEPLLAAPAIFVASPTHPLAREPNISIERLSQFKCGGSHSPRSANSSLLGLESDNLDMYTASHYDILLPIVLAGEAVLLAPSFIVQKYLESGELVVLDVQWRLDVIFHAITTRAASFSPMLRKVCGYAHEVGDTLRDDWRHSLGQFTNRTISPGLVRLPAEPS